MSKISTMNQSLLFLLVFTIIGSVLAYRIVVKAYENAYAGEEAAFMQY